MWRRVLVPGGYTLDRVSPGGCSKRWAGGDCHLHFVQIAAVQCGEPDPDGELRGVHDELDVRLDAVAGKGEPVLLHADFGDWWEHEVVVEDA